MSGLRTLLLLPEAGLACALALFPMTAGPMLSAANAGLTLELCLGGNGVGTVEIPLPGTPPPQEDCTKACHACLSRKASVDADRDDADDEPA